MLTETNVYIFVIASLAINAMLLYIVISSATKATKQVYNQELTNFYLKRIVDFIDAYDKNNPPKSTE